MSGHQCEEFDDEQTDADLRPALLARLLSRRARQLPHELFTTLVMVIMSTERDGVCDDGRHYLSGNIGEMTGTPGDLVRWHLATLETRGFIQSFHGEGGWCVRVLDWETTGGLAQ